MKHLRLIFIFVLVLISAAFFIKAGITLSKEEFSKLPDIGEEKSSYELYSEEHIPREIIDNFIVDSGKIYVFYEKSALVNVYEIDGSFEYGIQIATMPNGEGNIAVDGGRLYLCSRYPIIFVVEDGRLIETVDMLSSDESLVKYRAISKMAEREPKRWEGQYSYAFLETENDIIIEQSGEVILDFPEISNAGDYGTAGIALIWPVAILIELRRKK